MPWKIGFYRHSGLDKCCAGAYRVTVNKAYPAVLAGTHEAKARSAASAELKPSNMPLVETAMAMPLHS